MDMSIYYSVVFNTVVYCPLKGMFFMVELRPVYYFVCILEL